MVWFWHDVQGVVEVVEKCCRVDTEVRSSLARKLSCSPITALHMAERTAAVTQIQLPPSSD